MLISNQRPATFPEILQQITREDQINDKITFVLKKLIKQAENIHLHDYGFLLRDVNILNRLEKMVNKDAIILNHKPPIYDNGREYIMSALCAVLLYKVQMLSQEKLLNCLEIAFSQHQIYCSNRRYQS